MYRPQFPYKSPAECEDQRCVYSFDKTNTPFLTGTLAAGANISRIPLLLDKDADFYLRGFGTVNYDSLGIEFRLEDPKGHPLSDIENANEQINYEFAGLYSCTDGAGIVALDSDDWGVYCQQGSRLYLFIFNDGANPFDLTGLIFNLHGVKRYSGDRCVT